MRSALHSASSHSANIEPLRRLTSLAIHRASGEIRSTSMFFKPLAREKQKNLTFFFDRRIARWTCAYERDVCPIRSTRRRNSARLSRQQSHCDRVSAGVGDADKPPWFLLSLRHPSRVGRTVHGAEMSAGTCAESSRFPFFCSTLRDVGAHGHARRTRLESHRGGV